MNKISLYIPLYNGTKYLAKCLECVLKQTYPIDEILVIDDGSQEKTSEVTSDFPVKLIKHKYNKGLAAARNTAIMETRNDFIASIDVDCIIEPSWLEECMKNFLNPRIMAVGGKMMEKSHKKMTYRWRADHLKHHWGGKKRVNPAFLSGSNIVLKKEVFQKIGLYNAKKYKTNYEDVDLSFRIKEKGLDLIYEPKAIAWHIKKEDTVFSLLKTNWCWRYHVYSNKFIRRMFNHLALSIYWILKDILRGKIEFIFMDILVFPVSVYLDIKNLLITQAKKVHA